MGTHEPSPQGIANARPFPEFLVRKGVTVVSGLARGIDTVARRTAIDSGGRKVAVLGTPLDKVIPSSSAALQRDIGERHRARFRFQRSATRSTTMPP